MSIGVYCLLPVQIESGNSLESDFGDDPEGPQGEECRAEQGQIFGRRAEDSARV